MGRYRIAWWQGLSGKAVAMVTFILVVNGAVLTVLNIRSQQRSALLGLTNRARAAATVTAHAAADEVEQLNIGALRKTLASVRKLAGVVYTYVLDADGRVLTDGTQANPHGNHRLTDGGAERARQTRDDLVQALDGVLDLAVPIWVDRRRVGVVRVGVSMADIQARRTIAQLHSISVVGVFLFCSVVLSVWLIRRFTRPLGELVEGTRAVSQGEFDTQVEVRSRDELGTLAEAFNRMAETLRDTTVSRHELTLANTELEKARAAAEAANTAKSGFLANMSHEIRTPLTAIMGFAELLEESPTDGSSTDAAATIRRNADHLLRIINDILDLSKIEAGRFTVERTPCSPSAIAQEVVEMMRIRAEAKGLELGLEVDPGVPAVIGSDPLRIRQILVNLLGNAVKFTEKGRITVALGMEPGPPDEAMLWLEVRDTGMGLSPEQIHTVFRPFSQGDDSTTRRFGGTGLGLAITKRFAELLGGGIDVESEPGFGSVFRVTIRPAPVAEEEAALMEPGEETDPDPARAGLATQERPLSGVRVLIADDNPEIQRLMSFVLEKAGAHVVLVADGVAACEAVLSPPDDEGPFDVLLMDMQMPVMDGYTAAGELRGTGATVPIVAVTANAMSGDRQRCLDCGCTDYLTKPLTKKKLVHAVLANAGRSVSK